MDVRARVQYLIALALGHGNENEAHSAAMQACRLIREHRLLDLPASPVASRPWPDAGAIMDAYLDGLFKRPGPPAPVQEEPESPVTCSPVLDLAWCAACGQLIPRGNLAMWGHGLVWHRPCYDHSQQHHREEP